MSVSLISSTEVDAEEMIVQTEDEISLFDGSMLIISSESPIFHIPGVWDRIHLLPLVSGSGLLISLLICYVTSGWLGHSILVWPYISDVANCSPEVSIFSMYINAQGFLLMGTYYLRYKVIEQGQVGRQGCIRIVTTALNLLSLFCALVLSLGGMLAGSFPESQPVRVHFLSGILTYNFHLLYWILQVFVKISLTGKCCGSSDRSMLCLTALCLMAAMCSGMSREHVPENIWLQLRETAAHCDNSYVTEEWWSAGRVQYGVTTMLEWLLSMFLAALQMKLAHTFYNIHQQLKEIKQHEHYELSREICIPPRSI